MSRFPLQEAGLYAEVKAIFDAVADNVEADTPAQALQLRAFVEASFTDSSK